MDVILVTLLSIFDEKYKKQNWCITILPFSGFILFLNALSF
jgi:hypothetical protein